MANIDLSNLTRYDGKIKEYAEDKYLSKNTANWQMTEKAGAVTCYPVPDTELEPIVDFSFKEIPPVSGDKSPSNPSTITGVSSVNITRCGKNLAIGQDSLTHNGITFTLNENGTYTVNGTAASGGARIDLINKTDKVPALPNVPVVISGCPQNGSTTTYSTYIVIYDSNWNRIQSAYDSGEGSSPLSLDRNGYYVYSIIIREGVTVSNLIFKPQLERNSTITPFELYQGNNYTYQLGSTYYGGSVNLTTGEMIVNKEYIVINEVTAVDNMSNNHVVYRYWPNLNINSDPISDNTEICAELPCLKTGNGINRFFVGNANNSGKHPIYIVLKTDLLDFSTAVDANNPTLAELKVIGTNYLSENPLHVVYTVANPYKVQLTPYQIKSLTALDKSTPRLNTLYTDADSIQVGYQKHPARTSYELENAILALGGGE